jgi:uncharacterized protein YndB with AHSA1/START domain
MAKTALERKLEASVRERTLVMVRRFQASPRRVFEAWTNERELAQWMGAQGHDRADGEIGAPRRRSLPHHHALG